jgi:hypothetical protein
VPSLLTRTVRICVVEPAEALALEAAVSFSRRFAKPAVMHPGRADRPAYCARAAPAGQVRTLLPTVSDPRSALAEHFPFQSLARRAPRPRARATHAPRRAQRVIKPAGLDTTPRPRPAPRACPARWATTAPPRAAFLPRSALRARILRRALLRSKHALRGTHRIRPRLFTGEFERDAQMRGKATTDLRAQTGVSVSSTVSARINTDSRSSRLV